VLRRLEHLDELQAKARDVNRRLLDYEHVGQGCVLASPALSGSRNRPWWTARGPRPCASATLGSLTGALIIATNVVTGFTNRGLRTQVAALLGVPYSQAQASYDLRRLRLKGLIVRLEHSNTYVLTPDGQRVAIFYTKLHNRLLRPLLAADTPPAPLPVRQALRTLDHPVTDYIEQARLAA
jgi:hypothetical protein